MSYETQIAKGVALLDERRPRWLTDIDVERLDMKSGEFPLDATESPDAGRAGCGCVLAQIDYDGQDGDAPQGSYFDYARLLGLNTSPTIDSDNHAWRYGFTVHPSLIGQTDDSPFERAIVELTYAWKATILHLRSERAK